MEDHTGIGRTRSATSELVYRIRARIREQELLPGEKLGSERRSPKVFASAVPICAMR